MPAIRVSYSEDLALEKLYKRLDILAVFATAHDGLATATPDDDSTDSQETD